MSRLFLLRLPLAVALALALALGAVGCARASCSAMDVHGLSTGCLGRAGYVWTGTSCIYQQVCNCTGRDCSSLYSTQDACETAHLHCTP